MLNPGYDESRENNFCSLIYVISSILEMKYAVYIPPQI